MFKKNIIILITIFLGVVLFSSTALAFGELKQCGKVVSECKEPVRFSFDTGIVPVCFRRMENIDVALGLCDILQVVSNIIGLLHFMIIPVATIFIMLGGIMLLTAGGSASQIKKGQGFIKSALIGVAIALGAGIIISLVMQSLGVTDQIGLMPWLF